MGHGSGGEDDVSAVVPAVPDLAAPGADRWTGATWRDRLRARGGHHRGGRLDAIDQSPTVFFRLLLLLTVVPFVELMILLRLAERLGWEPTLALVIVTGVLGAWLARREGLKVLTRMQHDLAAGIPPAGVVLDAVMVLLAGVLLITPGVLTDLCGFALMIGPVRRRIGRQVAEAMKKRVVIVHGAGSGDGFVDVQGTGRDVPSETPRVAGRSEFDNGA